MSEEEIQEQPQPQVECMWAAPYPEAVFVENYRGWDVFELPNGTYYSRSPDCRYLFPNTYAKILAFIDENIGRGDAPEVPSYLQPAEHVGEYRECDIFRRLSDGLWWFVLPDQATIIECPLCRTEYDVWDQIDQILGPTPGEKSGEGKSGLVFWAILIGGVTAYLLSQND